MNGIIWNEQHPVTERNIPALTVMGLTSDQARRAPCHTVRSKFPAFSGFCASSD
jgi:hypothetical protein